LVRLFRIIYKCFFFKFVYNIFDLQNFLFFTVARCWNLVIYYSFDCRYVVSTVSLTKICNETNLALDKILLKKNQDLLFCVYLFLIRVRRVWRYQREVIRIRKSKDRQHNGQKKTGKNYLQIIHIKLKIV
jgi:hypothetical protein